MARNGAKFNQKVQFNLLAISLAMYQLAKALLAAAAVADGAAGRAAAVVV